MSNKLNRPLVLISIMIAGISAFMFYKGKEEAAMTGAGAAVTMIAAAVTGKSDDNEIEDEFLLKKEMKIKAREMEAFETQYLFLEENNKKNEEIYNLENQVRILKMTVRHNEEIYDLNSKINELTFNNQKMLMELEEFSLKVLAESNSNIVNIDRASSSREITQESIDKSNENLL